MVTTETEAHNPAMTSRNSSGGTPLYEVDTSISLPVTCRDRDEGAALLASSEDRVGFRLEAREPDYVADHRIRADLAAGLPDKATVDDYVRCLILSMTQHLASLPCGWGGADCARLAAVSSRLSSTTHSGGSGASSWMCCPQAAGSGWARQRGW